MIVVVVCGSDCCCGSGCSDGCWFLGGGDCRAVHLYICWVLGKYII